MRSYLKKDQEECRCRFNDGVVCNEQHCDKCGWNPKVHEERLKQYYKKHHIVEEEAES